MDMVHHEMHASKDSWYRWHPISKNAQSLLNLCSNIQKPTLSPVLLVVSCRIPIFWLETNDCTHLTGEDAVETQRCGEVPEFRVAERVSLYTLYNSHERQCEHMWKYVKVSPLYDAQEMSTPAHPPKIFHHRWPRCLRCLRRPRFVFQMKHMPMRLVGTWPRSNQKPKPSKLLTKAAKSLVDRTVAACCAELHEYNAKGHCWKWRLLKSEQVYQLDSIVAQ